MVKLIEYKIIGITGKLNENIKIGKVEYGMGLKVQNKKL